MSESSDEEQTLVSRPSSLVRRVIDSRSCLVTIYGPDLGRQHDLDREETSIGRGGENHIVIDLDNVSRRHAKVSRVEADYQLEDLNSTNGTFVNDREVTVHRLEHGDLVKIGSCILKFLRGGNIEALFHEEIYNLTIRDGLTQIHNRRYFMEFLDREMARCLRFARPLSLIVLDIDHFKKINDVAGHVAGDHVLKRLAELVSHRIRKEEAFARYGGEEFAVLLPETPRFKARIFAEKIRGLVENTSFQHDGRSLDVTVSLGVAEMGRHRTPSDFVEAADALLYRAKREGRNRVVAEDD
ncbi:MAG: diguanylate cyclase [Myxococcota bacterium]